jgi:hypothetical protein
MVAVMPAASAEIEYAPALLMRVLSHLVGKLAHARDIPHITGPAKHLVREWCEEVVPATAVTTVAIALIEAAIRIAGLAHPRYQADIARDYALRIAQDLHAYA